MLIRVVVVAASLACSAGAVADDLSSDAAPPQGSSAAAVYGAPPEASAGVGADARIETAPVSQRSGFIAPDRLGEPVSFEAPAQRALPIPALATDSAPPSDDAGKEDALNAPFWMFLLWYMGSR